MKTSIREYQEQDLAAVMAVWEGASALAHPFLPEEFVAKVRKDIPSLYLPNAETWVAENDTGVIGFIALLGNEVGAIFVSPENHGNGTGRLLMDKAHEQKGDLEVEVFSENTIGCAFYQRYGFSKIEEKLHDETGCQLVRFQKAAPALE